MDFSEQAHIKGEVYIYPIVLPLSDTMSVNSSELAGNRPAVAIFSTQTDDFRLSPTSGKNWGCRG